MVAASHSYCEDAVNQEICKLFIMCYTLSFLKSREDLEGIKIVVVGIHKSSESMEFGRGRGGSVGKRQTLKGK